MVRTLVIVNRVVIVVAILMHVGVVFAESDFVVEMRESMRDPSLLSVRDVANSELPSLNEVLELIKSNSQPSISLSDKSNSSQYKEVAIVSDTLGSSGKSANEKPAMRDHLSSNDKQSLDALANGVAGFVRSQHIDANKIELTVVPVDRRLRLNRCNEELVFKWTSATKVLGNTTVTAQCNGDTPWKVLVRVQVRAYYNIPVLTVPVNKGDILTDKVVSLRELDVSSMRSDTLRHISGVLGYTFKRRVSSGKEISSAMLAAPKLVTKGDIVLISASNQAIDIQMKGMALADGELGKKIGVRSLSSGRIIQSWIRGAGHVAVTP